MIVAQIEAAVKICFAVQAWALLEAFVVLESGGPVFPPQLSYLEVVEQGQDFGARLG